MSKVITSPVPEFPGTITLPDHFNMAQCLAWESALQEAQEIAQKAADAGKREFLSILQSTFVAAFDVCLASHEIEGWDDYFPMTPRMASAKLIAWIRVEIQKLYTGEIEIPNA